MSDPIARLNTVLAGRYEIVREMGEGGMAIVYLARDLKHNRNVALKVLKHDLAAVVGAERFLAEIEITANLQHLHILPLFDSGAAGGFLFYVMPYIEGETLRDRLDREKQLPVEEAIEIATAVAAALQAAHDAGVVHRDIKPGNILLSRDQPLVADFGIALAVGAAGGNRLTETGVSLGTPHYMSPEQATGDGVIGPPSDVYSLACVLYEMLLGEPPYTGSTAQAVLAKIVLDEPVPVIAARPSVPANVSAAIRKALQKLPADRFSSARAFGAALIDPAFRYGSEAGGNNGDGAGPWKKLSLGLAAVVVLAFGASVWGWGRPDASEPVLRLPIDLGGIQPTIYDEIAVSPEGSAFAVSGSGPGERLTRLHVRTAHEEIWRPVEDTENARYAEFSPGGDWIAYVNGLSGTLWRAPVSGGRPIPIVAGEMGIDHPHWATSGTLVFEGAPRQGDGTAGRGIYQVAEAGGQPELLLAGVWLHPRLLPGDRAVIATDPQAGATVFFEIGSSSARVIVPGGVDARYVETGHLVYADASGSLWADGFDPDRGTPEGRPTRVLGGVIVHRGLYAQYGVSQNGTLAYGTGRSRELRYRLVITDLEGNDDVLALDARGFGSARWSPSGTSIAFGELIDARSQRVHIYDVERRTTPTQLTSSGSYPVWSPDGARVAFASTGIDGQLDLFVKGIGDDSPPEPILSRPGVQIPWDWPAEDMLLFEDLQANSTWDLWIVDPSDSASTRPYLPSERNVIQIAVSPGGSLAAYTSDETGENQVYVRSFPIAGPPTRISNTGGESPRWSADGETLYFWKPSLEGDTLFSAGLTREPPLAVLSQVPLFAREFGHAWTWDLHPDGDRLVMRQPARVVDERAGARADRERYLVVTNWFTELRLALRDN